MQTQIEIQKQLEQQLHDSGHGMGMIEVLYPPSDLLIISKIGCNCNITSMQSMGIMPC